MAGKIEDFMRDRYSAHPLMLGVSEAIPGRLLDTHWGFLGLGGPSFRRLGAIAWEMCGLNGTNFGSALVDANIIQESIREKREFGGAISLPQYGLSLDGALTATYKAVLKVKEIRARVFERSTAPFELVQSLLSLKKRAPDRWDWVNDDFLITEAYYVTSMVAMFDSTAGMTACAAFQRAGQKIEGSLTAHWSSENQLELVGQPSTPVAIRGLRV